MSARKALFTASGVVNTSATSGSKTTTNGVLTAEMDSIGALSAQICPQFGFGRSLLSTQFARTVHHLRRGAFGFLDMLILPAPSQPPPFSKPENGGEAIAHGKGGQYIIANHHVPPFLFFEMGEKQLLMEREADIL